jgi:hypothetical protein
VREPEKPNNNEQRANHPNDDLHDNTLAAQINDGDIDRKKSGNRKTRRSTRPACVGASLSPG